jgi:hypothetical protein
MMPGAHTLAEDHPDGVVPALQRLARLALGVGGA